jgi:hypothetical protein
MTKNKEANDQLSEWLRKGIKPDEHLRNALFIFVVQNLRKDYQVDMNTVERAMDPRTTPITLNLLTVMKSEKGARMVLKYVCEVTEERESDRCDVYTARVLEGFMLAWARGPVSQREQDKERVYLKDIAAATHQVIDERDRQMGDLGEEGKEQEEFDRKTGKKVFNTASRKISVVMNKYLNLRTIRSTDGVPEYKGNHYVNMQAELERVKRLCERWGVTWMERGSLVRPQEAQVDFELGRVLDLTEGLEEEGEVEARRAVGAPPNPDPPWVGEGKVNIYAKSEH